MKAIMVRDCLSCPMCKFDHRGNKKEGGSIKCEISDNRIIGSFVDITSGIVGIPDWCKLSDWEEAIAFEKEMGFIDK